MRRLLLSAAFSFFGLAVMAQPVSRVAHYDEEDGLPHGHVTQLLQDELGFMWFATWNGLCRFDGYEFHTFKQTVGDGCQMPTDRFRDIALRPDGKIVCRLDDDYYLFDTRTCKFSNTEGADARQAAADIVRYRKSQSIKDGVKTTLFAYTDRQGNRWVTGTDGIRMYATEEQRTERLDIEPKAEVKCLFTDSQKRYWVTTKDDAAVRVYSIDGDRFLGYLGRDGRLHQQHTSFGAAIYCMFQSADGTLWMGAKPDGLFRLHAVSESEFRVEHLADLAHQNVYCIAEDRYHRLWVATLGGGLYFAEHPESEHPQFKVPEGYPKDAAQRLHNITFVRNGHFLLAAATDGLIVSKLEQQPQKMRFRRHYRESDRAESLSSSATMDIMTDRAGHIYISTESGGVNRIESSDLLSPQLSFKHFTAGNHLLPSDVVLSLTPMQQGHTMIVSSHLVCLIDSTGHYRQLDARYFNADFRFTDAHPQPLSGGRWLFALQDGAFITSTSQMFHPTYSPTLVLTGISIQGADDNWAVASTDTLVLQPSERSVTIHFAAICYSASQRISYAFRLLPGEKWNYIGHDRSATLLDLSPGTYCLEIRSTNADGEWIDNARRLTIIVRPTFWESVWGRLLMLVIIVATLAVIIYTILYIRRIKRKQRETLEAYLSLIESGGSSQQSLSPSSSAAEHTPQPSGPKELDPILQRVMDFIERNISNSDASVGDMAEAAALSRSGLQRKLKQSMGITPQDLLREARIKHACQLLHTTDKTVSDVAYSCGFSDPKYFSRCFRQSTGVSPTEYKTSEQR